MKKAIVIGSINIDNVMYTNNMPVPGMTVYGESFLSNIGGKGANQACALHFLGKDVDFYGAIGNDRNGKFVQNTLKEVGLTANLKVCEGVCTGVATIIINNKDAENQIIAIPGSNVCITKEDIDKINFSKYDVLLLQLENPASVMTYAMKKAKEAGLLVVLNPAPYQAIPASSFRYIDYFIPNEHELEQFTDDMNGNSAMRAKHLINKGLKNIIVTLGENGSLYVTKDKIIRIEPHDVDAVDTTGAGDSYCGAFVTALMEGKDVEEAMKFANTASSITVQRKGAISSLPKRAELDKVINSLEHPE